MRNHSLNVTIWLIVVILISHYRGSSSSSGSGIMHTTLIPIAPIHHPAFPPLPPNSNIAFELSVVMYLLTALCMQYMNIYKTTWWLPTYPASYSLVRFTIYQKVTY